MARCCWVLLVHCVRSVRKVQAFLSPWAGCDKKGEGCGERETKEKERERRAPLSCVGLPVSFEILIATFRVARLTLQTPKLWLVVVATDRDARHACLRFFSLYFSCFFACVSFHFFLFFLLAFLSFYFSCFLC